MSTLTSAVPALATAMQQQTEKLNEIVTMEVLMAVAGTSATAAYLQQVAVVKQATEEHAKAAAALKAREAAVQAFRDKLAAAGQTAQQLFSQASSAARGMVQAASPEAWSTLTDSFKLVAMQLGRYLIDPLIDAAMAAQDFAEWLKNLSPEGKKLAGGLGYAAGAVVAFGQANAMTGGLLGTGVARLLPLLATPLGLAGALVLGAGLVFRNELLESAKAMQDDQDERNKASQDHFSDEDMRKSELYKRFTAIEDPEKRRKAINAESIRATNEVGATKREMDAREAGGLSRPASGIAKLLYGSGRGEGYLRDILPGTGLFGNVATSLENQRAAAGERHTAAVKHAEMVADIGNELNNGIKRGTNVADKAGNRGTAESGKKPLPAPVRHEMHVTQARFSAVEEARKALQERTLNVDPMQQKLQQEALAFFEDFKTKWGQKLAERNKAGLAP
jgi:hypothetical protein